MAEESKPEAKSAEGEVKKEEVKDPVQARIDAATARMHKAEAKATALEKAAADGAEASLKEQKRFQELYEGAAPKAKLADELSKSIGEYFAAETADLSDEHKALIPEGPAHIQLSWVKKAKAAGVFGKQNAPDKTFNGKLKSGLQPDKWYLELEDNDPRVGTLPGAQYLERKAHRKAPESVAVRGGF